MNDIININLYSDTQTRPSAGMLRAMGEAEVGDEQHRQDPSVNHLCRKTADLLGKEAALHKAFLPPLRHRRRHGPGPAPMGQAETSGSPFGKLGRHEVLAPPQHRSSGSPVIR